MMGTGGSIRVLAIGIEWGWAKKIIVELLSIMNDGGGGGGLSTSWLIWAIIAFMMAWDIQML